MNLQEVKKQRFDRFKKRAMMIFTTALRLPLMPLMGCGYVTGVKAFGYQAEVHDHGGGLLVHLESDKVPYDQAKHGEITEFIKEGDRVPDLLNSTGGKAPIHRHNRKRGIGGSSGPYEYQYE